MEKLVKMYFASTYADQLMSVSSNDFNHHTNERAGLRHTTKPVLVGRSQSHVSSGLIVDSVQPARHSLTERELEVIRLVIAGQNSHEIADGLFISEHTVKTHRKNIFKKLGINRLAQLMRFAINNGLS